jgi:hypothetical protein
MTSLMMHWTMVRKVVVFVGRPEGHLFTVGAGD